MLKHNWNIENHSNWESKRKKGFINFCIKDGIFNWGGWMFMILTIAAYVSDSTGTGLFGSFSIKLIMINLFTCIVGGYLYGALVWKIHENAYQKMK